MKSAPNQPVCGAKNRQGEPCQRLPLKGKTRCKLHGGASKKGLGDNKRNMRHGIYTKTLTDEELVMYDSIQIGNVDAELRFVRIMLNRAIEENAAYRKAPNDPKNLAGFELTEITRVTGDGSGKAKTHITQHRPDSFARIDRLMGRIGTLEKVRAELIAAAATNLDNPVDKASELRAALQAMIDVETKQPIYKPGGDDAEDAGGVE